MKDYSGVETECVGGCLMVYRRPEIDFSEPLSLSPYPSTRSNRTADSVPVPDFQESR